ncbi:hypothetical protein COCVIDRAFT_27770 [Bipolaris victoriae FI3]|uniref:Uncharacterized protein n=1 Tax=Bipolaris victoriae (strain FI3) TaxID=930091 RepID=W7EC39_BIPV3|nr:hypothetical protein COCVIDRAFT_27770 [Bipolaris victoriae FI3]
MANEEQRRAFESYMGRANSDNGQVQNPSQPLPQYPGSVAQPGNPYLYQVSCCHGLPGLQFPGLGVPPAAPTPPPAASSSVASFPGYQGGYSQQNYGLALYGPNGIPRRPPPLGDPQAQQQQGQQHTPTGSVFQGHVQRSESYSIQPPPPLSHSGWPYNHPDSGMASRHDGPIVGAVIPASRSHTQEMVRSSSRHRREEYHYHSRDSAQVAQAPLVEEVVVPVMLCHTCSHCGQMRSAGFHRNNPVVPGRPLVSTPCRRCKKKLDNFYRSSSRYTRIRKCTADEPCDWPSEPFRVDAGQDESRGRRRSREEVCMNRYSPSRPRVLRRESSVAHLGLGAFQQASRNERVARRSSSSPGHSTRYTGGVWPPPDIVRMERKRVDDAFSIPFGPPLGYAAKSDEVWPPPDIVRTHLYRDVERKSLRRQSSRIIELSPSPSPPPSRQRSTRVVYRSDSQEHRRRSTSISPSRVRSRGERRSEEAESRLTTHTLPFRTVISDRQRTSFRASDETCSNADSVPRQPPESPTYSILKPGNPDHHDTTSQRRASMRASEQSVHVEVEGPPRVRFSGERREKLSDLEPTRRSRYKDEHESSKEKSEYYRDHSRDRVQYKPRPRPRPNQDFEKVQTRYCSPVRDRDYEEEIRVDKQRRISPSPSPPPRRSREYEEIRVRHVSPLPTRRSSHQHSDRATSPPLPPIYRHVSRTAALDGKRSVTSPPPPPPADSRDEDHTDCSSAGEGDVTLVTRLWKGIDENGRPATFVEERREVKMLAEGSERGGVASGYRDLGYGKRVGGAGKVWRDV